MDDIIYPPDYYKHYCDEYLSHNYSHGTLAKCPKCGKWNHLIRRYLGHGIWRRVRWHNPIYKHRIRKAEKNGSD